MGKHSKETENNNKIFIKIIVVIFIVLAVILVYNYRNKINFNILNTKKTIRNEKTVKNEKLVLKSINDYNKIIEYKFENNILDTVKIYEQFEKNDEYEKIKQSYQNLSNIKIIKIDDKELSIEIQKYDFGTDTNLTYDELYDKYLVQIVGAYEIVE